MAPSFSRAAALTAMFGSVAAQQAGTFDSSRPTINFQECDASSCSPVIKEQVVLDANWRWVHDANMKNCYKDEDWDSACASDPASCAANCIMEDAKYDSTYSIRTNWEGGLDLGFVTHHQYGENYGSRVYMMEGSDKYKMFHLKNREFTFDVDVSTLTCGLNGALYFVEMSENGDLGGNNQAGAQFGTGYCDAQCPHDVKWIKGEANSLEWNNTHQPPIGKHGACCAEMDIWEANRRATAYTPHPCNQPGLVKCTGVDCGDNEANQRYQGMCDKDGCDYNNYRMGEEMFYGMGAGFDLDTTKPMTVVTQFITEDGTDSGKLTDIKRFYVQDGRVIENSYASALDGLDNSVTDGFCTKQKAAFGDVDDFSIKGGLEAMGQALERGMVLVISLWDDIQVNMLWLDSTYPLNKPDDTPGIHRGPCPGGAASTPKELRANHPDATVKFNNIKVGTIGSTTQGVRRLDEMHV
eukprot:CAMPEP_0206447000 /NCGR_PEP_ID=MMETSP0324_2-20121206/16501_1 /ASSEMBLY_ACC=CAM_ASM_000836 /TAXON_ID=2866 /ORGANISM="Crypthecodinium cohnii, Strain Seligo" /LENGTH=466 /DNA_ID=CAMNT_0053915639 /DNA_START=119 /DNA_END=1519 /DNA_ORIENTATION=+